MNLNRLTSILKYGDWKSTGSIFKTAEGRVFGWGTTVGNGIEGWAPGALFVDTDSNDVEYNTGTSTTATWKSLVNITDVYSTLNSETITSTGSIFKTAEGLVLGWGTTVGNGIEGWAPSAIFFDTDTTGKAYINGGDSTTAVWKEITHAA